jgi:serine/threonine protein kinase
MNLANLVGQTLDEKYRIERELGKGGMGAVYLATHIGTERPVAVKVIVPQFMQRAEFVERFKREARAAGRLRHPNVVDVTDFGFDETPQGRVAYLVMEYLDGCTLGEILEEEKKLPLSWSLDILEQVCSAVHEAHGQGIIHRDLKPDNIWLEPNQRGGYTVKVLDFGIAKLEEQHAAEPDGDIHISGIPTVAENFVETLADKTSPHTIADGKNSTVLAESGTALFAAEGGTLLQPAADLSEKGTAILPGNESNSEDGTAILPNKQTQVVEDENGTRLLSNPVFTDKAATKTASQSELTRVGAVLGTPLYMSPEQCRGEKLDARSDIYSLAVIAYQMLGGKTPFEGDFKTVMQMHREVVPPPLDAKKVPKKVKKIIQTALSKDKDERPQTAQAFAAKLRAASEGIGELLRKSLVIYSEHLPKFLLVAFLAAIPGTLLSFGRLTLNLLRGFEVVEDNIWLNLASGALALITFFVQIFTAAFLVGITTWIVAQVLAVPLRPIDLRAAFKRAKSRWKSLSATVTVSTILAMLGTLFCLLPGIWLSARFMLIAPSIMMEGISGRAAFRRSVQLVKRSYRTVLATAFLVYFVPGTLALMLGLLTGAAVKNYFPEDKTKQQQTASSKNQEQSISGEAQPGKDSRAGGAEDDFNFSVNQTGVSVDRKKPKEMTVAERRMRNLRETIGGGLFELFWAPITILFSSFTSVVTGLLYFKTRLAGGESMQDLLEQFEQTDQPKSKWQERVEQRLIQSGRVTSKT